MAIGKTIGAFELDLARFGQAIGDDVAEARRRVAHDLFDRITRKTPVDTGRLRASWTMTDHRPSARVAPAGQSSYPARGEIAARFVDPFAVTWIVNNLAYAGEIEFGGRSKQAPAGMVRVSLAEVEAGLQRIRSV